MKLGFDTVSVDILTHSEFQRLTMYVYKGIHHHTKQPSGKYRSVTYLPISMAVPKPFFKIPFGKKLISIKIFVFEIAKVKVPNDDL